MGPQETLRPKFYVAKEMAAEMPQRSFEIGFYAGQMEKVVAGACTYCMFRPDATDAPQLGPVIQKLAERFGLTVEVYGDEFWVSRPSLLAQMRKTTRNSQEYHLIRAKMCGIPDGEADGQYHLRAGHENSTR